MHYLVLANISLVIFFSLYCILLRKETFFQANRAYLICTALFSFLIPLIPINWLETYDSQAFIAGARLSLEEVFIDPPQPAEPVSSSFLDGLSIWQYIYFLGLIVHLGWFSRKLFKLRQTLYGPLEKGQAFSFFGKIRVDESQEGIEQIKAHEQVHVAQLHSLELLIMELLHIWNWFNPVFLLIKRELKLNHEYIADETVCSSKKQRIGYAELLLHQQFTIDTTNFANHFKQENLMKKRIKMLFRKRSSRSSIVKYAFILPLVAILFVLTAASVPGGSMVKMLEKTGADTSLTQEKQFLKLVGSHFFFAKQAREKGTMGYVDIAFSKKAQTISEIRLLNDPGDGLGEEGIRLMGTKEIVASAPEGKHIVRIKAKLQTDSLHKNSEDPFNIGKPWLDGYNLLGEVIVVGYPARAKEEATSHPSNDGIRVTDYQKVEVQPVPFTGDLRSFLSFVGENYKFPYSAKQAGLNGQVFVSFVVEQDGTLSNIKVLRDLGHGTGEEAIRVIKLSEKWKPGYVNGQPVAVSYSLPIRLNLQSEKENVVPFL